MKTITFVDGSTLNVTDGSTIYDVIAIFENGDAMLAAWSKFTKANMTSVSVNDEVFTGIIPVNMTAEVDDDGLYTAHFINRDTTEMEQVAQAIKDNQDAIAELGEIIG